MISHRRTCQDFLEDCDETHKYNFPIFRVCAQRKVGIDFSSLSYNLIQYLSLEALDKMIGVENPDFGPFVDVVKNIFMTCISFGIQLILVAEFRAPPNKNKTYAVREKNKAVADATLAEERKSKKGATRETLLKAFRRSLKMVYAVFPLAYALGIRMVLSPFETDHQLTWMVNNGIVHAIWVNDGDYIALGAKCLFMVKNFKQGLGRYFSKKRAELKLADWDEKKLKDKPVLMFLKKFGFVNLPSLVALSGNDYVNVDGIGLVKAAKILLDNGGDFVLSKDTILEKWLEFAKTKDIIEELRITVGVFRNQQSTLIEQSYQLFGGGLCFDEKKNIYVSFSDWISVSSMPGQCFLR